jgi:hypothetical protein
MRTDLVDNNQIHIRVKAGGEGTVVFDSAIALLQGLFPPNLDNRIELANGTTIVAPLSGYQYVPGERNHPYELSRTPGFTFPNSGNSRARKRSLP